MTLTFGRWAVALGPDPVRRARDAARDFAMLRGHWLYVGAMGALGFTAFNALFYVAAHLPERSTCRSSRARFPPSSCLAARFGFGDR